MSPPLDRRSEPLTVESIVVAACSLIDQSGLGALSMRRLGSTLGVDPMAVYHHIPNKRQLLALVTARVMEAMALPVDGGPWDVRLRAWAMAYWRIVVANRDLVLAGLADPVIAEGGMPWVAPLTAAVADSGVEPELVEPNAWLVVDFVHGSALGASAPLRHRPDELESMRVAFERGLDTIVTGLAASAATAVSRSGRGSPSPSAPRR
jgi:TetR/AcrR family tetracycline transcriptional repressor